MKDSNENKNSSPTDYNCNICKDDGKCLNNENHPDYENDIFGNGDIYDCVDYQEKKNGTEGQFIMNWLKKIQKRKKYEEQHPYQSDFSKWNQSIKKDVKK